MKKRIIYSLLATFALFTTSCDKNKDNYTGYATSYTYATVKEVADEDKTSWGNNLYFEMDTEKTFIVQNNKALVDLTSLNPGERVITGITLLESNNASYDYFADLYEIALVVMGANKVVNTEEESSKIENNNLAYISNDAMLSYGYLNLLVGFIANNAEDARFYLVENNVKSETATDTDSNYLYLELRADLGSNSSGTGFERYLSFDMEQYREKLEGKDGVILKVNTTLNGPSVMHLDGKYLFPEDKE